MLLLPSSTVGRKIMMAITGQILVIFIVFHIAGNSTIFFQKLNAYVEALHALPVLVWAGRGFLFAAFVLHIWYGTVLKLENSAARPQPYAVTDYQRNILGYQAAIYDVVVLPQYQDKGVGKKIMNHLVSSLPVENIILYSVPGKEGFYGKYGFRLMKTAMAQLSFRLADPQAGYLESSL